jgi:diguanylate cyclase (GGDEF)-like protein
VKRDLILIVEDSKSLMTQIINTLKPNYDTVSCYSVTEFMEKRDCNPSLILMDYNLNDVTCLDLISSATAPVIILTSEINHKTELACLREGAVDYINKPFHPDILLHRIDMHINIVQTRKLLEGFSFECSLTGIKNRRAMERDFMLMYNLRRREGLSTSAAFMLLDIDKFKAVNDTYGHDVGDIVLCELADIMNKTCKRVTDGVYRWGGEEFAILVPVCTPEQASNMADLVRRTVEKAEINIPDGTVLKITVSIGAVSFKGNIQDLNAILKRADELLYKAKNTGRNNVQISVI